MLTYGQLNKHDLLLIPARCCRLCERFTERGVDGAAGIPRVTLPRHIPLTVVVAHTHAREFATCHQKRLRSWHVCNKTDFPQNIHACIPWMYCACGMSIYFVKHRETLKASVHYICTQYNWWETWSPSQNTSALTFRTFSPRIFSTANIPIPFIYTTARFKVFRKFGDIIELTIKPTRRGNLCIGEWVGGWVSRCGWWVSVCVCEWMSE